MPSFHTGPAHTGYHAATSHLVASATTATSDLYQNADGSYTGMVYAGPVNYQAANGSYQPISTQLATGPDGRWHEQANSVAVSFAAAADDPDLAALGLTSGQSYSFGLAGAAHVTGSVSGSSVTYPGALPGTDLVETAAASGLKESLVLHSAGVASTWVFPLNLQGLTAVLAADGSVDLDDSSGNVAAVIPPASATDSAFDPHSGNPAQTFGVTYQLIAYQGGQALQVSLDKSWLDDPARVFPVTVDPTGTQDTNGSTYVLFPYTNDYSSDALMQAGTYDAGTNYARSFFHIGDISGLTDDHVTSASFKIFDAWAYTCTPEPFSVYPINEGWSTAGNKSWPGPTVDWSDEMGTDTEDPGAACPSSSHTSADPTVGKWLTVSLSPAVLNDWILGTMAEHGIAVTASLSDETQYKQFDGSGSASPHVPYLQINYTPDVAPQINEQYPPDNYDVTSLRPELQATGSDPDNWPDALTYQFTLESATGKQIDQTGWRSSPDWTVPAGDLSWNQTYCWYALANDGQEQSTTATENCFSTMVSQPAITSGLAQNTGGQGFDPANANYTTSATDASVSTVGPALTVTRDYNSADPRDSEAFGAGWSSMLDARVDPGLVDTSGAQATTVVTYPDGQQVGFGDNTDGTFTPPEGRYATLASVSGGGYTLTDKNDTVYTFTQSLGGGSFGLTSITDAIGHALNFTWDSGQISTITSAASGRALHLTWVTPAGASAPHVASVATDPVTSGNGSTALTWTYNYTGDQLAAACPPTSTTVCTSYSYASGAAYQNTVLDMAPHSYWPLDEASGTTAASAVLVNEGTDDGTYSGVTLGQPGPLAGSAGTAAAFNGTSSAITLPSKLVSRASYQSISVWFKTTGSGVLFSYQNQPLSNGTANDYTPSLYVGTSGYLYGEFWNGHATPIKSSSPVNDGQWHQAVLTGAGSTQTLYLDGAEVGTLSGTISMPGTQNYDYAGTGYIGGPWPDEPNAGSTSAAMYYGGDLAGAGLWDRVLTPAEVTTLYQAGTQPASLLTKITRPTGSVYANVSYDPVTGAVSSVTDDNGGAWQLGTPAVTGSNQVYVSSVLGAGPADYWRMGDTDTTEPVNQVNGETAENSDITEGQPGPFSDSSAYSFDGSTSSVALPSGLVDADGSQSVSLWFKTSTGGGILLGYADEPLSNGTATHYTPALYLGPGGDLHAEFWNGSAAPIMTSSPVDDGKWHNVVLTASGGSQTLYLDGTQVGWMSGTISNPGPQDYVWAGAGYIGGPWPNEPNSGSASAPVYFQGDMAELAFFNMKLTAGQVAAQYAAAGKSAGNTPLETVQVTDPGGNTLSYSMDPLNGDRLLSQTDALGNTTQYGYDTSGFLKTVTDPDGNVTTTGHDIRGNVVSEATCQDQSAGDCSTTYYTYYPDDSTAQPAADPRNDLPLTERGPGSSSGADNTYLTTFAYNSDGEVATETTPPVAGFPDGRTTTTTYTTASTAAVGGGTTPAGLPATVTTPGGAVTTTQYYSDGDVAQVTDPDGLVTKYSYDGIGRLLTKTVVSDSYPAGLTTSYSYNANGEVVTETDPPVTDRVTGAVHTAQTTTGYDADGDVTSQTVADLTGGDASRTTTSSYNGHDQLTSSTDPAGASTSYTYNAYGDLASETDAGNNVTDYAYNPNGQLLTVTLQNYTGTPANPQPAAPLVESSRAYDPAGRLASVTSAMGFVTSYTYTDNGLLATETRSDPQTGASFTDQSSTYNAAGQLTQQVTNNGATTTGYTVDAAGRTTAQTVDPSGLDRTTSYSYTPDDQVADQTLTGPGSSGPVQDTRYTYDPMGNPTSQVQYLKGGGGTPTGWWQLDQTSGTAVPDASGTGNDATAANVTWAGGAGTFNGSSSQVATGGPVLDTTGSFTVSAWVNMTTPVAWEAAVSQDASQASAFQLQYDASTGGWAFGRKDADTASPNPIRATSSGDAATGSWQLLTGTYDASTGTMTLYVNGTAQGTATDTTPYAANGPLVIGRGQYGASPVDYFDGSISDVRVYQRVLSASEIAGLYSNGRNASDAPANKLTTTWALDQRGLPTSMTDPDGNTTYYSYDEAGQLAVTTSPTVSTQTYGGTAAQTAPVTMTGYDTFGEPAETSDPDGNVTTTGYDADGHPVSVTQPPYTPPGSSTAVNGVTTSTYNGLGEVTSRTDPLGNKTAYTYDQVGDVATSTAPDGGVTSYGYDPNGDQLSVTGPTGAVTDATYDYLGRQVTATAVERYPSEAADTTNYTYATGGWLKSEQSPAGVVTSYGYDAAGETTSVTDGAGNTTGYGYDAAGRQVSVTNPDGTSSTSSYDEAGRLTGQADLSASGAVLRSDSADYDDDGNLISATDYRGNTTTYTYDATGLLASEVQPVTGTSSITTSFGYDAAGNRTRYTDGNGNDWWTTYNSWNLPESQIEPATSTYSSPAQGTFTTAYDADGNPTSLTEPGGVTQTSSYNNMGELTGQSGSGADAATATRSFGYDLAGNLTSAGTSAAEPAPATSESFSYDDRGLLLTASGTAGSTSLSYNADGQPVSVSDAAGTTSYTYDSAGRLATLADPLTGTTATYSYTPQSQVSQISYGPGNDVRSFGYNSLHELTSDTLATAGGQTVASISYGYDPNGNLTSKTTAGFAGSSANTYTYDEANRLTSWNNGATTTSYGYDGAGNRTSAGSQTFSYDARDELTSDGTASYSYTARGTLASVTGGSGAGSFTSDAYGQALTQAGQSYTYDALGRAVTVSGASGTADLSYSGTGNTLASDDTSDYAWDPSGTILAAIGPSGGSQSQGTLALTDAHTDVTGDFAPAGASLAGSASYDPWGTVTATSGLAGHLGYQSGWTDPVTGRVDMGARWYDPAAGGFTSKDTVSVSPVPDSATANPFGYAGDNPLDGTDPTGHLYAAGTGGCWTCSVSTSHASQPAQASTSSSSSSGSGCAWYDVGCDASHAWHAVTQTVTHYYHDIVHVVSSAAADFMAGLEDLRKAIAEGIRKAGHAALGAAARVADAASAGAHVLADAGRAVVSAGAGAVHSVTRYASGAYHHVAHVIRSAAHVVAHAATATVTFVKHHAAAIASVAASVAVFAGCEAVLGVATGGVGAIAGATACGALAGAVGNAVGYGITAAQTGHFSWSALGKTALEGAAIGAATGFAGGAAAEAGGLLARGAAAAAEETGTAAAATGAEATATAAGSDEAASVAEDASAAAERDGARGESCLTGGQSFTAGTKVLTASGALVAISHLKVGQKVLATSTKTGKTKPFPVTAVLVHHDTDRYDLTVRAGRSSAVIHTTRNHLFWDPYLDKWVSANKLSKGEHLKPPDGGTVTVVGGTTPKKHDGWMWDLTVPGNNDHDFYVTTDSSVYGSAPIQVLVHNENAGCDESLPPYAKIFHVRDSSPQDELPSSVLIKQGHELESGDHHYVVMESGELRAARSEEMYGIGPNSGHTSLSQSEPVIMAGHFNVDETGSITEFDNWSGHYWPQDDPGSTPLEQVARTALGRFGLSEQIANATWSPISYSRG